MQKGKIMKKMLKRNEIKRAGGPRHCISPLIHIKETYSHVRCQMDKDYDNHVR